VQDEQLETDRQLCLEQLIEGAVKPGRPRREWLDDVKK